MLIHDDSTVIVLDSIQRQSLYKLLTFVKEEVYRRTSLPAPPAGTVLLDLYLSDLSDLLRDLPVHEDAC